MNELDKLINKNNILKEKLPLLKEIFISFYGDLYRQKIEDSFNNLTIVSYMMPKSIEMNLNDADKEISRKFQIEFLQAISVEPSDENLKLFFDNVGFKYQILMPIVNIYELLARKEEKELSEYENKRLFENLSKILKTQITVDNLELAISYFQKIKPKYEEMIEKYQQVFSKYQGLQDEIDRYENQKIKLQKEFNIIFFEMLKDYLSKEDILYLESCKNNPNSFYSGKLECNGLFCDYSFYQQGLIEFF